MLLLHQLLLRFLRLLASLLPLAIRRTLLLRRLRPAQRRLLQAHAAPARSQAATLLAIVEAGRGTEFGRAHAFHEVRDPASYAARVPLRTYRELEPYIQRHQRGEAGVLLEGPVLGFALSGGSRGEPRPFPVSAASLDQWTWAEELLARQVILSVPAVARGALLHLLPVFSPAPAPATCPTLPFPVLAEALGRSPAPLPAALPWQLFAVADEAVRFYLVLRLALHHPVTALRAASPGTLSILAEHLERLGPRLVEDVGKGRIDHLEALSDEVRQVIPELRPRRGLALRLRQVLERGGRLTPRDLWPGLRLIISSTDGPARAAADRLSDRYGNVTLLDPGYRAAEGIVTLPGQEGEGGLLALAGQYLEFLPEGEASATLGVSELRPGQRVQVVMTGSNGIYRYLMDDLTEVREIERGVPRLAVIGRAKHRLRLGEGVLTEEEVGEAMVAAVRSCGVILQAATAWLEGPAARPSPAPERVGFWARLLGRARPSTAARPHLQLALEPDQPLPDEAAQRLLGALESEIRRSSPHYHAQRAAESLGPPSLLVLEPGTFARRSHRRLAEGRADAHAAPPALTDEGWLLIAPKEVAAHVQPQR